MHTAVIMLVLCQTLVFASVARAAYSANISSESRTSDYKVIDTTTLSALLAVKQAIFNDSTGFLARWDASLEPNYCNWRGVRCAGGTLDVVALLLDSKQLEGTLSPHIQHLSKLSYLNVSNNSFHGPIPSALGELSSLTHLDLKANQLTGSIPATLANCTRLQFLALGINGLSGKFPSFLTGLSDLIFLGLSEISFPGELLPADIGRLSNLQFLEVYRSNLSGSLPPSITNCTSLVWLQLAANSLSGPLPSEWSKLSSIQLLDLNYNFFTGSIPATLGNCTPLVRLALSNNSLTGKLPESLGKLAMLQYFELLNNRISGAIPPALMNCTALAYLELGYNQLTGSIPSSIGQLKQGKAFIFTGNAKLSGGIPVTIGDCAQLNRLSTSFTEVGGPLPRSLYNLSSLQNLRLSSCRFSGSLSNDLRNLTALMALHLDDNDFVGRIPPRLGELTELQGLYLQHNRFWGPIPQLLQLKSISVIDLSFNRLSGGIPVALGQLQHLNYLHLQNNHLSGDMPNVFKSLAGLLSLDFSHNRLTGTIPQSLSVSESLDLSFNNLTGRIPPSMGSMRMVTTIKLAVNHLSGGIPDSLAGCQSLQALDLSVNNLSGEIPRTFGQLVVLQYLDLSHNNLSGALPASLGGLKSLVTMNVSYNALQGVIPSMGIYHRSPAAAFMGNPELCGQPLKYRDCSSDHLLRNRSTGRKTTLIVSLCSIGGLLIMICACICLLGRKTYCLSLSKKRGQNLQDFQAKEIEQLGMLNLEVKAWTAAELSAATNGFDPGNIIGSGGGSVCFKGMVEEGRGARRPVAIKRLDMKSASQREVRRSFAQELKTLCQVRHRNLVRTLGYCMNGGVVALVLELMEKGSLHEHLQSTETSRSLSWAERMSIAADVAEGLVYLHHELHQPIVHCDLKPANILLGADMVAKIADFGIAKFLHSSSQSSAEDSLSTIKFKGTFGYAAPECVAGWRISTKVDVYSYGVMILELMTGMKPTSPDLQAQGINMHTWATQVLKSMPSHEPLLEATLHHNIVKQDPTIAKQFKVLLDVATRCTFEIPQQRPTMKYVKEILLKLTTPDFCRHQGLTLDEALFQ